MAVIKTVRTRQPTGSTPLALPQGLTPIAVYLPTRGRFDAATGAPFSLGSALGLVPAPVGLAANQTAVNTGVHRALAELQSQSEYTLIWHGIPIGTPSGSTPTILGIANSTTSQTLGTFQIDYSTTTQLLIAFRSATTNGNRTAAFTWADTFGLPTTIVASVSFVTGEVKCSIAFGGKVVDLAVSALSSPTNPTLLGTEQFIVGPDVVEQPTRFLNARVAFAGAFYGRMTDTAARSVLQNPWQLFAPERRLWVPHVDAGGAGAQALSPSLLTNSQAFYAATVSPGAVALTATRFDNAQTFYSATISQGGASQTLTPGVLTNTQSFYSPTITPGTVTLAAGLLTNAQAFYSATISQGGAPQTLSPSLLTNAQAFYGPSVAVGTVTLTPSLFNNGQTFYAASISQGAAPLFPPLLTNAQTFYSPTLSGGIPLVVQRGLRKTRYTPGRVPSQQTELVRFLQSELERLTDALESPFTHQLLEVLNVEPSRKREGMVALADGTNWNPGSGKGVYVYYSGAWQRLG